MIAFLSRFVTRLPLRHRILLLVMATGGMAATFAGWALFSALHGLDEVVRTMPVADARAALLKASIDTLQGRLVWQGAMIIALTCLIAWPASAAMLKGASQAVMDAARFAAGLDAQSGRVLPLPAVDSSLKSLIKALNSVSIRLHDQHRRLSESETALRDQLQFVEQMLEIIPNPIYVKDERGRYLRFNRAWADFFGYRREDFIGRTVTDLFPGDLGELIRSRDQALLDNPGTQSLESDMADARGGTHVVLSNKATFTRDNGAVAGLIGVVTDMTERTRSAAQLRSAREAAEQANRTKSDFLANMSHEIRTPMNAILGMTDLLLDTPLDAEQRQFLGLVKSAGSALLDLLNDILDFSKIEAGRLELEDTSFTLAATVTEAAQLLAQRAKEKGLTFGLTIAQSLPAALRGDPGKLRQVLLNLIGNALKFTESGSVGIEVREMARDDDSITLHVLVADTGIGIPADKLTAVFDAFAQADASTTRRYGGTGLGLAICQKLVEAMGGGIWVESTVGIGSTFQFTARLRFAEAVEAGATQRDASSAAEPESAAGQRRLHVLLVDDHPVNQTLAVRLLQKLGHRVDVRGDGQAAVDAITQVDYDLVLMDVQMPIMGGFEATAAVRAWERQRGSHLPIIAMTAHALTGDRERCLAAGMDGYVSKPIDRDRLREAIEAALARGRTAMVCLLPTMNPTTMPAPIPAPGTASPHGADLDLSGLFGLVDGDSAVMHDIIGLYLDAQPQECAALRDALARRHVSQVRAAVHGIKGSASGVGGVRVQALASALEIDCDSTLPGLQRFDELLQAMAGLADRLLAAGQQYHADAAA